MSKNDPNEGLSADAALAVEHTPEREAEQLSYMGGERDEEFDDFDPTGLDDGSDPDFVAPEPEEKDDETEAVDDKDDSDAPDDKDAEQGDTDDADEPADAVEDDSEDSDTEKPEDTDGDEDEDDVPAPAAKGIPKHRFDEVNNEKKALREENANLKAQIAAGKPVVEDEESYDIQAGEKEYMDLLLDGDVDAALAKRNEVDSAKKAEWKAETQTETRTNIDVDAENSDLLALSQEAQKMFDVFDPEHENYDQSILDKVMVYMRGYEASGNIKRTDAFVNALSDVAEQYDLMPPADDDDDTPKPKPLPAKKGGKKKEDARADAHQPVGDNGAGSADAGVSAPDVEAMTDEEFDALPEASQARLRGDFV